MLAADTPVYDTIGVSSTRTRRADPRIVDVLVSLLALSEMERVAGDGPFVFLTFDYRQIKPLWLADYFPALWADAVQSLPPLENIASEIRAGTGRTVEIVSFAF